MDWSLFAIVAFSICAQVLIAAAWVGIGGLGGQWRINRILIQQQDDIQRTDQRITREIKQRAGREGQEARQENKSVVQEAKDHLAAAGSVYAAPGRPSTIQMINGGRK